MLENFRVAKFLMQERQGIMIMKFYGRETERKKLNSMFQTDGQMISLIYGRRRIGKSELIRQVLKETELKSIYYECKQTTEQNNVGSFSELVGEAFDFPKPAFADMESLLRFLFRTSEKMGGIIFYEAKFHKEPVTAQMIQEEIRQVEQTGLKCYKYGFFQGQDLYVKRRTT